MNLQQDIQRHIQSLNNTLTDEHLETLSFTKLLRLTHPTYRGKYALQLYEKGLITGAIANEFAPKR